MYRVFGVTTLFALALSGCSVFDRQDDNGFAEEPVPVAEAEAEPQLAALPPIPARRPNDMSTFIPPEAAHLAEKRIEDLVGLSLKETESLLGGPSIEEVQAPAKIWSYNAADCVLSIFFYPRVGGEDYRALAYQVTGPDAAVEQPDPPPQEAAAATAESGAAKVSEADRRCFTTLVAQNASARKIAAEDADAEASETAPVE